MYLRNRLRIRWWFLVFVAVGSAFGTVGYLTLPEHLNKLDLYWDSTSMNAPPPNGYYSPGP